MEVRTVPIRIGKSVLSMELNGRVFHCQSSVLEPCTAVRPDCGRAMGFLPILPPHSANRYDAGCRGAGADCVVAVIAVHWSLVDANMQRRPIRLANTGQSAAFSGATSAGIGRARRSGNYAGGLF